MDYSLPRDYTSSHTRLNEGNFNQLQQLFVSQTMDMNYLIVYVIG